MVTVFNFMRNLLHHAFNLYERSDLFLSLSALFKKILFVYFGCAGFFVAACGLSHWQQAGTLSSCDVLGFSTVMACLSLQSTGSRAKLH